MNEAERRVSAEFLARHVQNIRADVQVEIDKIKAVATKGDPGERGEDAEVTDEQISLAVSGYIEQHPIPVPRDGKDVDQEQVSALVYEQVSKAVEVLPKPADVSEVVERVFDRLADPDAIGNKAFRAGEFTSHVIKAVADSLPKPIDGRNAYEVAVSLGFDGDVYAWQESLRGEKGLSVTADQVLPALQAELQKAIAAVPVPKDGKDSAVTADDFRSLFEAEQAKSLLDLERRSIDMIQRHLDRIEKPKDGRDAIDLATLDIHVEEDFRTWRVSAKSGDQTIERTLHIPVPMFQGMYIAGTHYKRADIVGFGGSAFIARRDTASKPETDDSWQMFVKRGRDGKPGDKVERATSAPVRFR